MPVDPNISMQTVQPDIGRNINAATVLENNTALTAEQTLQAHYQNMSARDQSRLRSTVVGAAQLKTYLDKGDLDGAHDFLMNRQKSLHSRMANGEDIDDQETAYALDKIRRGDLDGLKNDVGAILAAGQAYNMIGGSGTPSSVQEWQYYNSLSAQDQQRWLQQKRAGSNIDLGDKTIRLGADGKPEATYPKGLAPADQPVNAENKADATARGTVSGTNAANAAFSAEGLKGVSAALKDLQTSGNTAPGGVAQNLGAQLANQSGIGGASADAQGNFTVKRAAAENAIREAFRVAGSGSQSDADAKPFIDMLPVADDAQSVKVAKTNAAMQAVENRIKVKLQQSGAAPMAPTAPGPAAPTAGAQPPVAGALQVSNGQDVQWVMPENLARAQAEGYQPIQ